MDLTGEGIKEASKLFQSAAWAFEHLKSLLPGGDKFQIYSSLHDSLQSYPHASGDFAIENLNMLKNLMLAQAQYLFYKKAMDN